MVMLVRATEVVVALGLAPVLGTQTEHQAVGEANRARQEVLVAPPAELTLELLGLATSRRTRLDQRVLIERLFGHENHARLEDDSVAQDVELGPFLQLSDCIDAADDTVTPAFAQRDAPRRELPWSAVIALDLHLLTQDRVHLGLSPRDPRGELDALIQELEPGLLRIDLGDRPEQGFLLLRLHQLDRRREERSVALQLPLELDPVPDREAREILGAGRRAARQQAGEGEGERPAAQHEFRPHRWHPGEPGPRT